MMRIKTALLSVTDKTGLIELAKGLVKLGVEIISTGGTALHIKNAGIDVTEIHEITGVPEFLGGRVKTLHPNVHGGILARRSNPEDLEELKVMGIDTIDMVVVNLYPFEQTVAKSGVTMELAMENVDIGGPTMLRAAAKNHKDVVVICNPQRYAEVLVMLEREQDVDTVTRTKLAQEVFAYTSRYDSLISSYLSGGIPPFPENLSYTYEKVYDLRYGENPHQKAAFYKDKSAGGLSIAHAKQLHGKELSFNNVNDASAALDLVLEFTEPAVVALKHTNPCGVGLGSSALEAYKKAYESDPVSIFGGIVAVNREVDQELADLMSEIFLEVVIAPSFTDKALEILTKKPSLRLLEMGEFSPHQPSVEYKHIYGGMLVQEKDAIIEDPHSWKCVTDRAPSQEELDQLYFGWRVVKHVKSNAVLLAKDNRTVGIGAGQMNRILPTEMSIKQAGDLAKGSVLASDAYFPFDDVVKACAKAGVTAIVQPGGSVRDQDSIIAANQAGIAMVFTGIRHFKH
jgi:phosphoribosylaminoimidazolecarboxamide formyltransferase/IMP cyclohydrolase